jgi:hypothetical protein
MFYTYAHYTPQGRIFYIGKGAHSSRAYRFKNRNVHWNSVVAKYGKPKVQVLATWDTEKEAFEHEVLLIACFKDIGVKLCNMTDGGEGASGRTLSEEHKEKISAAQKGKPGKKPSAETLIKLRESHLGQKAWNKGLKGVIKQTPETIAKRMKNMKGHKHNVAFKYVGTNTIDGTTITLSGNIDMVNAGFAPSSIRRCASGERKMHKNYTWVCLPIRGKKC